MNDLSLPTSIEPSSLKFESGTGAYYSTAYDYSANKATTDFQIYFKTTAGSIVSADAVAAVPEPATWGMMILGFGVVGASMRRRKSNVRTNVSFA